MRRASGSGVYTLRPTTREERRCCCPFIPGCWSSPCQSKGTRWEVLALVRERFSWADASPTAVISEDRRAEELARISGALSTARRAVRLARQLETVRAEMATEECAGCRRILAGDVAALEAQIGGER